MAIGPSKKDEKSSISKLPMVSAIGLALAIPMAVNAAPSGRQLEEVVVTAERQEASVQDTSISITAFTGEMLEDFGIRDQTDLQNFVPATVILPYDAAVRGVGRNFRNLGGDPGISTYMNGVYSEDLYTATIGSFWDMERIEVLRGPQGTLYGRNAVGGAMNFIYNKPSQEFDYRFKAMAGNFDAREFYGMVNGALIEDQLSARFAFSNRNRDGYVKDMGGGPDLDSRGEENYSLQLNWTPTDNIESNIRTNEANVYRVMGGADGGGLIQFTGTSEDGLTNDTTSSAYGLRVIDPAQTNPLASDYLNTAQPVVSYTNPATGQVVQAQKLRSGIDESPAAQDNNYGWGSTNTGCIFTDKGNIKGDDLCAYTNGGNYERFDQHGIQWETNWDVNDALTLKYIYGFNKLSYQRQTEDDSFSNTIDRQFYVNHEANYTSHELQAFYDFNDQFSVTVGAFTYDATIDQRGDFFDGNQTGEFVTGATDPVGANLNAILGAAFGFPPDPINLLTAKNVWVANNGTEFTGLGTGNGSGNRQLVLAPLYPDAGGQFLGVKHGPDTKGTDLLYGTQTKRDAYAFYGQAVYDINEDFTLTAGIRYAKDDVTGEENLYRSTTLCGIGFCGFPATLPGAIGIPYAIDPSSQFYDADAAAVGLSNSLASYNVALGLLDPVTLEPTGVAAPLQSIPMSLSIYRKGKRSDDKITYRVNLDWNIDDSSMMYFSVTTGYRGGGFNLVFFSETQTFNPEELIAYEIGYKSELFDNTLQFNASAYFYDYSTIHTFGSEPSLTGGITSSVLEAPGAEIKGLEFEGMWLATDNITVGGNFSYTPSKYSKSLLIVDDADPRFPAEIFTNDADRQLDIKGNQVLQVPEFKGSAWAAYNMPLGDSGNLEFMLSASWIDEVFFSQFETALDRAPAYERYDFRTTWKSANENWQVVGFVTNLLDEVGIRQIERHGENEGYRRTGQVTEPRQYGIEVTYNMAH